MPYIGIMGLWTHCWETTGADGHESNTKYFKIILTMRSFKRAIICLITIAGTLVMQERIIFQLLVKARFPDPKATDPKSRTVLLTTKYQRNYVQNFSSLSPKKRIFCCRRCSDSIIFSATEELILLEQKIM
jgi:hypothetical protein